MPDLAPPLIAWYRENARDLPWRRPGFGAWGVLVSEFMLQQTPVDRVIPHLAAWLERWPSPADLAAAAPADAVRQWANLGALVAALFTGDRGLLSRSLEDGVAEPKRAGLVPGFYAIKEAAVDAGALGCSLSGSGPSMFALAPSLAVAAAVGNAMQKAFAAHSDAGSDVYVSPVGRGGARVVAS